MIKKKYLISLTALFALAVVFWLNSNRPDRGQIDIVDEMTAPPQEDKKVTEIRGGITQPDNKINSQEQVELDRVIEYLGELTDDEKKSRPDGLNESQWLRSILIHRTRLKDNGDVKFYGKIVDQNDHPLQNVQIDVDVLYYEPSMSSILKKNSANRNEKIAIISQANGEFEINYSLGRTLTLKNFSKKGYQLEGRKYFVYNFGPQMSSPHNPDPSNPVVFRMVTNP